MSDTAAFLCACGKSIDLDFKKIARSLEVQGVKIIETADMLCSPGGIPYITQHLRFEDERKPERIIIAACSRKEKIFKEVALAHSLEEDAVKIINIRETCGWVHEDKRAATEKALAMIKGALQREKYYPEKIKIESNPNVLVIGSTIDALRISRELIKFWATPHVISESYIKKDCGFCIHLHSQLCTPSHRECLLHLPELEVRDFSKITAINGSAGNFSVEIERGKHIDASCIECGKCAEVCPKGAIYSPPDAVFKIYVIEEQKCDECKKCLKVCPVNAIKLEKIKETLSAGCIISFCDIQLKEGIYACKSENPIDAFNKAQAAALKVAMYLKGVEKEKLMDSKPELCANFKIKKKKLGISGCTSCADACAYGAIASGELSHESCQYCGACIAACPQGVTFWKDCEQMNLMKEMQNLLSADIKPKVLMFYCSSCGSAAVQAAGENKIKYPAVLQLQVSCLGSVAEIDILRAFDLGFEGVLLTGCVHGKCANKSGVKTAARNTAFVKKLLEAFGIEGSRVKIVQAEVESPQEFADSINKFVEEIKPLGSTKLKGKEPALLSSELSRRDALLALVQGFSSKLGVADGKIEGDFWFGDAVIDTKKCTLCAACAAHCATKAFETGVMPKTDGWVPEVKFVHTYCTACKICEAICPEKAIRINNVLDIQKFIALAKEELKIELVHCERCGKPIMACTAFNKLSNELKKKELGIQKLCRDCRDRMNIAETFGFDPEEIRIFEQGKMPWD